MGLKIFGIICLFILMVFIVIGAALVITALFIIAENDTDTTDNSDVIHAPRDSHYGIGSTRKTTNTNK